MRIVCAARLQKPDLRNRVHRRRRRSVGDDFVEGGVPLVLQGSDGGSDGRRLMTALKVLAVHPLGDEDEAERGVAIAAAV